MTLASFVLVLGRVFSDAHADQKSDPGAGASNISILSNLEI